MKGFASDNYAGVHPAIMERLARVNVGHVPSYGEDPYTDAAVETLREHFGSDTHVRFVFNGTAANILCLDALATDYESVICADSAHINTDECGAPEKIARLKMNPIATPTGKLCAEAIAPVIDHFQGFEHGRQPRVVSISNVTELGTIYTPDELKELAEYVHSRGLLLHCDGARLANAAAALGVSLAALSSEAGVDALSLGGTKNGMMCGEAALWFGETAAMVRDTSFLLRKSSGMLGSKMRYISAQFSAMFEGDLWLECARHANKMAQRLIDGLPAGVELAYPSQANEIFAYLPQEIIAPLQEEFHFYTWDEPSGCVRWVVSWDTTEEEVDSLLKALHEVCS